MLMDLIQQRHSIRKYTDEQIPREDLEKILAAGTMHQMLVVVEEEKHLMMKQADK